MLKHAVDITKSLKRDNIYVYAINRNKLAEFSVLSMFQTRECRAPGPKIETPYRPTSHQITQL